MAIFIAVVRRDGDSGFTASFPDFPGCAVGALTLDLVIAKAKEALLAHIERLLVANQRICVPTTGDAIELGDALLLAAVEVPDDLRMVHLDLDIPPLSLARLDSFARRHGLTLATLFVEAVNRWDMHETIYRERRRMSDGPTLFDFGNPLELRVEAIAAGIDSKEQTEVKGPDLAEEIDLRGNADDVTAELARLLGEGAGLQELDEPE